MNERSIFLTALEKEDGTERSAFLDSACGPDLALRRRVEFLLQSHTEAGSFLAVPALQQGSGGSGQAADSGVIGDLGETQIMPGSAGDSESQLEFLSPSQKAGSLGRLGHYEVLELCGRGGFGQVLRAFDEKLHRVVAVKVMAKEIATNALARKRFLREAQAAAAVTHENVVAIHEIQESGPVPYLVMQFVDGKSLQQRIKEEGSLELREILRLGLQVASGLAAAHKQGLVHRDIKPANILLENGVQRVKITDFGLARAVDDSSISHSGIVVGTPQYMSPEQADGQPVDHRSDLFSLGSVLYAMCTGRSPFRGSTTLAVLRRVCEETPRPIPELNPDIPQWLCDLIAKLHAKKPGERYQTAKEVAGLLEERLAHVQASPSVSTVGVASVSPARSGPVASTAAKPAEAAREQVSSPILRAIPSALVVKVALGLLTIGGIIQVVLLAGWITKGALYGWASGAAAVGLAFLAYFFLYHFVIYLRAKRRTRVAAGPATARRWPRVVGYGVLILLGLVSIAIWGNVIPQVRQFFYHELVVQLPDTAMVVQFWETSDEVERENAWNFSGAWPMEPRATIANTKEKRVKLPPANYWMFVTKDGKSVERRLLKIGWGGKQTLVIHSKDSSPALAINDSKGEWVSLFNGKDLAGWKTVDPAHAPAWKVNPEGYLVGNGGNRNPGSYLFTERGDFTDFHLRAEARINEGGNSGIYFRVDAAKPVRAPNPFPIGYEAQIFNGNGTKNYEEKQLTGSLYMLAPYWDALVKPDEWFTYEIIAQGNQLTLKVNAKVTATYVDEKRISMQGHVGLQQLGIGTTVQFRKIEIQELPATRPTAAVIAAELDRLQGDWIAVAAEEEGQQVPPDEVRKTLGTCNLTGDQWRITVQGQPLTATVTIDPTKQPKAIDFLITAGPMQIPAGMRLRGIYQVEGNFAKLCINQTGGDRPTEFVSNPQWMLLVTQRQRGSKPTQTDFLPLFNGKDLTGWRAIGGKPGTWKVENGILRAAGSVSQLVSDKSYGNFTLRAEVRSVPIGGWGMDFRTDPAGRGFGARFTNEGPVNDVAKHVNMGVRFTIEDRILATSGGPVKGNPVEWLPIELTVQGDTVDLRFPGGAAEGVKLGRAFPPGPIIIRLDNADGVLEFRKIEIKELPAANADLIGASKDEDKLQGSWKLVSLEEDGEKVPEELTPLVNLSVTFTGDRFHSTWLSPGDSPLIPRELMPLVKEMTKGMKTDVSGIYHLNTATTPRRITVLAPNDSNNSFIGIYRVEGDTLTLCLYFETKEIKYPTEFTTKPKDGRLLAVFKREPSASTFIQLFNSKDLTGWKPLPEQSATWKVENGMLVGRGPETGYLFSQRDDFQDFHLRAEAKIGGGNSGIYFRVPTLAATRYGEFPDGYEANINSAHGPDRDATGSLTGSLRGLKPYREQTHKLDEWFILDVIARGPHLVFKVNGRTTVDFVDANHSFTKGRLALQAWSPETVVHFRKIEIKELLAGGALSESAPSIEGVRVIKRFGAADFALAPDNMLLDGMHWQVTLPPKKALKLFRVEKPGTVGRGVWAFRGQVKNFNFKSRVSLHIDTEWQEESRKERGLGTYSLRVTDEWQPWIVTLSAIKGTRVAVADFGISHNDSEGGGTIWLKDVELVELSLDGRWVAVSAEYQGNQVPPEEAKDRFPSELLIKDDQYGLTWAGKQHEGSLHIDAAKSPAEIDFAGSVFAGLKPRKAIFEIDGDRLKLCMPFVGPNADPPRPTEFKTDPQSKNVVLTYRRKALVRNDEECLHGTWKGLAGEIGGKPWPEGQSVRTYKIVFEGDKFRLSFPGAGKAVIEGSYQLSPQTDPKQITFFYKLPGAKHYGQGIYRFEGDQLRLHLSGDRPKEFVTRPGEENTGYMVLLEREASGRD